MEMCNYQVGDLLSLETTTGRNQIYIVITELFGCTIRVKNIVTGRSFSYATTLVYKVIKTDIFCP